MIDKYDWLIKKTPRSVDQLRLWAENPRLNPEENHLTLRDFAEDLTEEPSDKKDFYDLVKSIVRDGFVPYDPVVIWKSTENEKYYVAEGNRRVVALKLLREPDKAPKSIRSFIRNEAKKINITTIEKIPVNVAPSFEDAEWYINQRNSSSSLQRRWTRVQQQRWIFSLYEKYDRNLDKILSITKLEKSELESFIRIIKIKDFVKLEVVKSKLTEEEFEKADSYKFPITILERIFNFTDTRKKWGIEFDGINVIINSNKNSFYNLFAELIKRIINNSDANIINTRINKENLPDLFDTLPDVSFEPNEEEENTPTNNGVSNSSNSNTTDSTETEQDSNSNQHTTTINELKGNPNRNKIVLPIYELNTDSYRLLGLFNEFKRISLTYKNSVAASLRVFLDLAVLKYIEAENLETEMLIHFHRNELKAILLKKRLEYLKTYKLKGKPKNIVSRLIDPETQYSLDVLNGYIHSQDSCYLNKQLLNGFWDFLFPLFETLLDIKEK